MKLIFIFLLSVIPLLAQTNRPIAFEENGLYGFKNKFGNVIIKPQYQHAMDFTKELVGFVVNENRWYCINTQNKILLEVFPYDNGPDYFSENFARYVEDKKFGFFDSKCKKIITANYDFVFPFESGLSIVCNSCESKSDGEHSRIVGGKYGAINTKGVIVIPIEWDSIDSFDFKKKIANVTNNKTKSKIKFK
ncbi:WG repeat-containing protein [Leptospira harrisiae]|uniref:WG repeat-containing protein n=1 Tax=Leptospira harrisiae TaxID=2023189 RepID=A0A2N0AIY4_9LEPT|nr:WG repeat-containing protein [Leptospira harrisiae]PJZ84265.1 hypothetical protein CH364_13165 [Leptospira harrisiae]PKA07819.1 hypothetical protein CH366_15790 [Leptospira harrisiae]